MSAPIFFQLAAWIRPEQSHLYYSPMHQQIYSV